jgi:hypothetical protein
MKEKKSELIVDENGIEVLVSYTTEYIKQIEEFHGIHDFSYDDVELTSVEVVISGKGIDILRFLDDKQISVIKDNLSIY